jgi:glc operon protein GlcG
MLKDDLPTKKVLTLAAARAIVETAEAEARRRGFDQLSIAVVDDGGHALYFLRQDAGEPVSAEIAFNKARAAAIFTRPTKHWNEVLMSGKSWVLNMPHMAAVEGGLPIKLDGRTIGAIGVAGGSGIQDGEIAAVGAAALDA